MVSYYLVYQIIGVPANLAADLAHQVTGYIDETVFGYIQSDASDNFYVTLEKGSKWSNDEVGNTEVLLTRRVSSATYWNSYSGDDLLEV
ncbi:hypothetical protein IAU59_005600 [Kwoniella sp. CBS 9459]